VFPKRRILALEQDSGKGKAACCRQESAVLVRLRREINGGNIPFPLFLGPQKQPRFHSKPEPPGINALITARRKFRFWIEIIQKNGGERGIRTLGGSFDPHSLSRRAKSCVNVSRKGFKCSSFTLKSPTTPLLSFLLSIQGPKCKVNPFGFFLKALNTVSTSTMVGRF